MNHVEWILNSLIKILTSLPSFPPIDINVHFACRERYYVSHYGAKLWKATSVDDPELRKLKALFDALSHH